MLDDKCAAVDNDFLNHIAETKMPPKKIASYMTDAFSNLKLVAVMHTLVYEKEVLHNEQTDLFFDDHIIHVVDFSDIFQESSAKKKYYCQLVARFYNQLNGVHIPAAGETVLSYWKRQESLGEIHSLSMCLTTGCAIFLSDDGDSKYLKEYIERNSLGDVKVYNREEYFDLLKSQSGVEISRSAVRALTHVISR